MSEPFPVTDIAPDLIAVSPDRLRKLRPEVVEDIAKSMATIGQLQPIVVAPRGETSCNISYVLVAGWHRLEAAKKVKWELISCTILRGRTDTQSGADHAALAEIDENLIRAELSATERAMHADARKKLYEKLHPETKHGGDRKSSSRQLGDSRFTAGTARATGASERKIQRDATRGKKVKVLPDIVGTSLDKGEELDALAKLPESEQLDLAAKAKAGLKVSARPKMDVSPSR